MGILLGRRRTAPAVAGVVQGVEYAKGPDGGWHSPLKSATRVCRRTQSLQTSVTLVDCHTSQMARWRPAWIGVVSNWRTTAPISYIAPAVGGKKLSRTVRRRQEAYRRFAGGRRHMFRRRQEAYEVRQP